jgi:hypothetical protein
MRSRVTRLAAWVVLIAAGCGGPKAPPMYPATGKVVYTDGAAMPGGTVQFQPQPDGPLSAFGEVGKDGLFSLITMVDGKKIAGAAPGSYRVTIIPPFGPDQAVQPVSLPDMYTVKPESRNDFTFTVLRQH